jgi:hypothetical protein
MSWYSRIPIWLALPLFIALFATVAVFAHSLFRRLVPSERLAEQYDVAGFLVSVVGVLYSVVLGFLVGTVWTTFASAQQTTNMEAGYVADAFNFAAHTPAPQRQELERLIARYAIDVRDVEWPLAEYGRADSNAANLIDRAIEVTVTMPPPPASVGPGKILESNMIRSALLGNLRNVADTRRLRLVQMQSRLPAGMYEALILGALMVISFAFFFGVKDRFKQMALTALVAGSIGLFFGLVVELSTPYSGSIQVSRDAWTYVIENNHLADFAKKP